MLIHMYAYSCIHMHKQLKPWARDPGPGPNKAPRTVIHGARAGGAEAGAAQWLVKGLDHRPNGQNGPAGPSEGHSTQSRPNQGEGCTKVFLGSNLRVEFDSATHFAAARAETCVFIQLILRSRVAWCCARRAGQQGEKGWRATKRRRGTEGIASRELGCGQCLDV